MLRRYFLCVLSICITLALSDNALGQTPETKQSNIVFFLVDDLGFADVGFNGSTFYETPHIDALAKSGMRFDRAYAACPVCSPTRASILTGRHPVRVDITDWIPGQDSSKQKNAKFQHVVDRDNLALDEITLAETLKENGYQTFFAGKWHLGDKGHWPTDQGFDFNIGGCDVGSPPGGYYAPWNNPNLVANSDDEYLTERLTAESIKFIDSRNPSQPFLLYLSYYNVHTPITPYKKRVEHFREKAAAAFSSPTPTIAEHSGQTRGRQDNADYASMIAAVDDSVGAILAHLDQCGLTDNTIICFFSDNGGLSTLNRIGPTCNLPLRSGKGWLYEGGIREPMVIRAPGLTKPGSICKSNVISMDFYPTLIDLAGLNISVDRVLDGVSLVPILSGAGSLADRSLYWHYPHYHGSTWTPGASILDGDWKLIEFYHLEKTELYNLGNDPSEQHDLSIANAAKKVELQEKLSLWQKSLNAKMPVPIQP